MIVRRFGVWSVARMFGVLYAAMGLVFGAIVALFSLLGAAVAQQGNSQMPPAMAALFGVGAVVALPIFYGLLGLIGGAITAALYNLFAGIVGGVEVDVS